jgi:nitric oxide reductase activation protein
VRFDLGAFLKRFGPKSALQKKGVSGTPFNDVQRRIGMYMLALWGEDFSIGQTGRDFANSPGRKPFVDDGAIFLPDAYPDFKNVQGLQVYRAAAIHAAAHLVYRKEPFTTRVLDNWQIAVISAIEDARIEALAIRHFPGLKSLWASLHHADPSRSSSAKDYLDRLARALLDESYVDSDPWVELGRALFREAEGNLEDEAISRRIGIELAGAKQIRIDPSADMLSAPYRDDNSFLWEARRPSFLGKLVRPRKTIKRKQKSSFWGMTNEVADEADSEETKKASVLAAIFNFKLDFGNITEQESRNSAYTPFHYHEWDYRKQILRQSWVLILEKEARTGNVGIVDDIIAKNKHLISRMKILLDAIQPEGVQRIRKLEEGDDIDINAAIRAQVDLRMGLQPDIRIMMSSIRKTRDISVLVLLDISKSTNLKVQGQSHTVLELTREACVLLADAIKKVGDPFAIHGFCSDSRHHVEYYRYKDFDKPYDDDAKARIAGMTGQLSTRMGAAIRHASHYLGMQKTAKKLLMVITDGEPSDVDMREDHKYLQFDAKKAVEEARKEGIHTYCMSLDPKADEYVARIFGMRNYLVLDHVARLPEKLPILYAGLTR